MSCDPTDVSPIVFTDGIHAGQFGLVLEEQDCAGLTFAWLVVFPANLPQAVGSQGVIIVQSDRHHVAPEYSGDAFRGLAQHEVPSELVRCAKEFVIHHKLRADWNHAPDKSFTVQRYANAIAKWNASLEGETASEGDQSESELETDPALEPYAVDAL